jgi:hypothetical protein
MDHISNDAIKQISEALATAADAACTALHRQQCKIVESPSMFANAKIEAVLRIQKMIEMNERSMWRALRQIEGPDDSAPPRL